MNELIEMLDIIAENARFDYESELPEDFDLVEVVFEDYGE